MSFFSGWNKWLAITALTVWTALAISGDDKFHVVFCDVGQGNATLMYKGQVQILVDGGPDDRVGGCLTGHMSFYDNTIEVVVLTHAQSDHMTGLLYAADRYKIGKLVVNPVGGGLGYEELVKKVEAGGGEIVRVTTGDKMEFFSGEKRWGELVIQWPSRQIVERQVQVLGATTWEGDENEASVVAEMEYGDFEVLLTGDIDTKVEEEMLGGGQVEEVEVILVPHHGSKTGMTSEWLETVKPQKAVVSVGKNSFGHPTSEAMDLLAQQGVDVFRTDEDGEVEMISDGKKWWVK